MMRDRSPRVSMQRLALQQGGAPVEHSTGFGAELWLVKRLCLAMGGKFAKVPTRRGGTAFIVRLPRRG
jgi:signal transduction histidine kinase